MRLGQKGLAVLPGKKIRDHLVANPIYTFLSDALKNSIRQVRDLNFPIKLQMQKPGNCKER